MRPIPGMKAMGIVAGLALAGCATQSHYDHLQNEQAARSTPPDHSQTPGPAVDHQARLVSDELRAFIPGEFAGPQPVEALIAHALEANPTVRAARFNVISLQHRIPQATALDDPILSNSIYPIPSAAPQYSLMGYMPYGALLAQQFPWCGTLRLRGLAAGDDVQVGLQELAAAQLDVVANVKRAYFDLRYTEKALDLLKQNRALAEDFLKLARERYQTASATQVDVLRAEVVVSDIDREIATTQQAINEARSDLVRLLSLDPDTPLQTLPESTIGSVPRQIEQLSELAVASRPELRGRLAAIARDQKAVELARKRYYPNLTLGVLYQNMEKTNAMDPKMAGGMPNVGFFVGMNLPIYHKKLAAGVGEAQARAAADHELYLAERDQAHREVKDYLSQARTQENVLTLLRRSNLPTAKQVLDLTAADYRAGNAGVDYLSLVSAWRELLQVELQIAQVEAELGKALAALERAVGTQINEHPIDPEAIVPGPESEVIEPAAPATSSSSESTESTLPAPIPVPTPPASGSLFRSGAGS